MSSDCVLNGVRLPLKSPAISQKMREKITNGFYEKHESECIRRAAVKGDRLLEVGAGIGYISALAWLSGNFDSITIVEANPDLIPVIEETHRLNSVRARLINGAAVDDGVEGEKVPFYIRDDFWASSMSPGPFGYSKQVEIPKINIQDLLDEVRPTFFVCDIEGGELGLIPNLYFKGVKKVMIEFHQNVIGRRGMKTIFDAMSAQNFHYDQWHSSGSVVLFSRTNR